VRLEGLGKLIKIKKNTVFWDVSSGMLRRVARVRADGLEERIASIIKVTRIGELGTTLAVTSNRSIMRRDIM
jgi:hypothetical protein